MRNTIHLIVLLFPNLLLGQVTFEKVIGGNVRHLNYTITENDQGDFLVSGFRDNITGNYLYLMKISSQGDSLWQKQYCGRFGRSIIQLDDGGYVIGASSWCGSPDEEFLLVRTDSLGDTLWTAYNTIGGSDELYCMCRLKGGDYFMAGFESLARADSNGVFKWTKSYYGDLWDCAATYDSGYVVVGWNGAFNENYRLYKYDKNDSLLWVKKYIGPGGGEYFLRVKELADSSIYVIGNGNLRKMRFSANGDSLGTWVPYPGLAFDTTSNGRMVFLARLAIAGPPLHTDFLLMLTDSANNLIWSRTFGGPGWETPYDVRTCADGGFVMTGIWDDDAGIGNPNPQVYVVKTDSMGYVLSSNINALQHMRSGLMLYPNPATETSTLLIEHFQQSRAPYQAKLYDMQGRLIQTVENIVSNEQSLSLQTIEKGLYLLILNDRHGALYHSIKLMKE